MLNSLKEPTLCRNHSRATKIGVRMWNRNELCSNGVPCRSRMRKRISPSSPSSISSLRRAKLTRAAFTTERSVAIEPSSRTKPWSRTRIASSAMTLSVVATGESSLAGVHVGTSGWSYPSWKPGFYPAGTDPKDFLRYYTGRFSTVELNTTGYRLPAEEQFSRWAEQTPAGFTFAPKLAGNRPRLLAEFGPRVRALGDRLGPIRVQLISARDEGMIELILGSLDPALRVAFDLAHPSWDGIEPRLAAAGAVRINDLADEALRDWADRLRAVDVPLFAYFRHEEAPAAPAYASRLLELLVQ